MKNLFTYICALLVSLALLAPNHLYAAGLAASTDRSRYEVGDSFLVQIRLQTDGTPVNAVSGTVLVPDFVEVTDVRSGGSIVSLWTERPTYDPAKGELSFAGGIPGGFTGITAPLFTLALKAVVPGKGTVAFKDTVVLKNDGTGSPYTSGGDIVAPVAVIAATNEHTDAPLFSKDNTLPEPFLPVVWFDTETNGGAYVVSFNASDADSGIDHYEVKETPRFIPFGTTEWIRAENLYTLKNQMWITDVSVRAIDRSGNIREITVVKPFNSALRVMLMVILFTVIIIFSKIMRKKYRPARKKRVQ